MNVLIKVSKATVSPFSFLYKPNIWVTSIHCREEFTLSLSQNRNNFERGLPRQVSAGLLSNKHPRDQSQTYTTISGGKYFLLSNKILITFVDMTICSGPSCHWRYTVHRQATYTLQPPCPALYLICSEDYLHSDVNGLETSLHDLKLICYNY